MDTDKNPNSILLKVFPVDSDPLAMENDLPAKNDFEKREDASVVKKEAQKSRPVDVENTVQERRLQESHARKLDDTNFSPGVYETLITLAGTVQGFFGSIPCIFCCSNPYKTVRQGDVGLLKRFGKCIDVVDPGLHKINLFTDELITVNIKIRNGDIPRQYVMTKDNVGVYIDSVLTYRVTDPYAATFLVSNVHQALIERTQSVLRQIVGTRMLQECIEHRDSVANDVQELIEEPAASWGTDVESVLIKDIQLSPEVLESLSAGARQRRIGESKVIAAESEVQAAQLMKKASEILSSTAAMQIRYLETLQGMSKAPGTRIVFTPLAGDASSIAQVQKALEVNRK